MDIQQYLNAFILGIVEGITDFLPVSSTGHLILFNTWFRFPNDDFTKMFDIVIQTGAILAVVIRFRQRLFPNLSKRDKNETKGIMRLWARTIVGFLPIAVTGAFSGSFIQGKLMKPLIVAANLILWGVFLIILETRSASEVKKGNLPRFSKTGDIPLRIAFCIGVIQCLGIIPGTSRSAATIIGAMLLGASRVVAAEFSFFLAIPTLIAAGSYSFLKLLMNDIRLNVVEITVLGIGMVTSFLVAWFVIPPFMDYIRKRDFRAFGWYRILLGAIVLGYMTVSATL